MDFLNVAFLALVQGITEFLPISSSGHLILGREVLAALGLVQSEMSPAQELAIDIALHVGSLGAVLVYFWRDIWMLILGLVDGVTGRFGPRFRVTLFVVAASLPIVAVGFLARDFITDSGRAVVIIAWTTLIFGILLWIADRAPQREASLETLSLRDAMIVGLAQCLAVIPGVSRSGICMTAGRFVGLDRPLSAKLAMLLSIPTILGAGMLAGLDLYQGGDARVTTDALVGGLMAFGAALAAIAVLMKWLERQSYTPFVVYRVILGVLLLGLAYGGLIA